MSEVVGNVVDERPGPQARLRLDDAGVVCEADEAAADLLGCRVRDLIGKPFVVFVAEPLRRPLFVALRDARLRRRVGPLRGELLSRDPVALRAALSLVPGNGGVGLTIGEVEREVDRDRLLARLRQVGERQRDLAGRLDAVTRTRPATFPDLDVGAEPTIDEDAPATTVALHDWRLLPSGELLMFVVAAHGRDRVHEELVRSIRDAVRALVSASHPPGELVARVERLCGLRAVGPIASLVAAYGSPDGSRVSVVAAGGLPLVRRADGSVEGITAPGPALGSEVAESSSLVTVGLAAGDAIVLHAEGTLTDPPSARERLERRLASLQPEQLGGAATARQLIEPTTPHGTSALLCAVRGSLRGDSVSPEEQVRILLGKDELRDVARSREQLSSWLSYRALRVETIERAVIVISELLTNAVTAASDRAELRVSVARGAVIIEVNDDGSSWHPESALSPESDGGHGLRVASALCEELHVASSGAGTVIRARVGAGAMR